MHNNNLPFLSEGLACCLDNCDYASLQLEKFFADKQILSKRSDILHERLLENSLIVELNSSLTSQLSQCSPGFFGQLSS